MLDAFDSAGAWPLAWLPDALLAPQGTALLRVASAGYATRATDDPASTVYEPRILGDVELSQSAVDLLGLGGRIALTVAELALDDADGWAAEMARYGSADGRGAVLRTVPVLDRHRSDFGTSLAGSGMAFAGVVRSVERTRDMQARVALGDLADRLSVPLQPSKYAGSGDLEGGADLAGKPRPVCLGRVYNVPPVFLGNVDLGSGTLPTYQTHSRQVAGTDAVRIRGVAQSASAGTPIVGQYRDWPALGCFQLGAAPDGEVRADLRGDAVGGYVNSIATVLVRLLQAFGPNIADAELDTGAFALADFDLAGEIGFYQAADTTAAGAAETILAGCGAVLAGGRSGRLRLFDPLASDAPQFTLLLPWIISAEPIAMPASLRPAPREVQVEWGRNWAPLTGGVAGSVAAADRQRLEAQEQPFAASSSQAITSRVQQQRSLRVPGLYWDSAAAAARAAKLLAFLERGPRLVRIVTDRFLGQLELGHIGRLEAYPAFGLEAGLTGTVMAWREQLGGRRLEITLLETG